MADHGISRFPCDEFPCVPRSRTPQGGPLARDSAGGPVAFRQIENVGTLGDNLSRLIRPAHMCPYRRFARPLTRPHARLGAEMDRYSFLVQLFHLRLIAGLPAHRFRFRFRIFGGQPSKSGTAHGLRPAAAPCSCPHPYAGNPSLRPSARTAAAVLGARRRASGSPFSRRASDRRSSNRSTSGSAGRMTTLLLSCRARSRVCS